MAEANTTLIRPPSWKGCSANFTLRGLGPLRSLNATFYAR
jgi:hypothetical protein